MKRLYLVIMTMALGILLTACSASTANISGAELGTGYDSATQKVTGPTNSFGKTEPAIHCVIGVANAPEGTAVRTVWTAVEVTDMNGNAIKDNKIDEKTFSTKDIGSTVNASLTLPSSGEWPVGKYKVEIYLDDKLDRTLEFTVHE